jgi:hypothetical protein
MPATYKTHIATAQAALKAAKNTLHSEISAYPSPIFGCDTQFNQLLDERQKVIEALRSLDMTVFVQTPGTLTEHAGVESR